MKKPYRTLLIYALLIVAIFIMANQFNPFQAAPAKKLSYAEFMDQVREGKIKAVNFASGDIVGLYKDTKITDDQFPKRHDFEFFVDDRQAFHDDVRAIIAAQKKIDPESVSSDDYGFTVNYVRPPDFSFAEILPYIILIGGVVFLWFMVMQQQGGGKGINSFGKSRARLITEDINKVTFNDVAGADEEKEELAEIVEFLKNPQRFLTIGARIPKGVLLMGPPGTGKTLLAKAVAGEAGVPFYSISGSDFVEMFVGVGASRVRDLFTTAKKTAPAIVFIDEIDAVGRHRGAGLGGGHDEREQTLNQLLVEMDGFAPHAGIIVVAATNRPDILDPALLRPGRFDRQVTVGLPDVKGREAILGVHARRKPLSSEVELKTIAKRTPGFTGADLENVLNEAAILSARRKKEKIGMEEVEEAITRVVAGPEKKSRVISAADKRITAFHEAGHAIISKVLPNCDPVHEVSIIPRGRAAGYTMTLPEEEKTHLTKSKLLDQIVMLLGGRAAEAIYIDDISTGAYNDLSRATDIARKMVIEFGMSERLGPIFLGGDTEVFVGKDFGHARNYSEEVAALIDEEIQKIIGDGYKHAEELLKERSIVMNRVVDALIERERLDGDEFNKLYEGIELEPFDSSKPKSYTGSANRSESSVDKATEPNSDVEPSDDEK